MNTGSAITLSVLASLTPTANCLIGIIPSHQDAHDLRGEHLGQFYALTGKHQGRPDEIFRH